MDRRADQNFADRLNAALKLRGVRKMYPLALDLGVDESAISRWRQGRAMSIDNVIKLCRHLDLSIDWLLTGQGEMAPPTAAGRDWADDFRDAAEARLPHRGPELSSIFQMLADACRGSRDAAAERRGGAMPPPESSLSVKRG